MTTLSAFALTRPADTRGYDRTEAWQERAACREVDPELFFPHPSDEAGAAVAKAVCATCPVLDRCREEGLMNREPYGVWGGLDERERRNAIRRSRRAS